MFERMANLPYGSGLGAARFVGAVAGFVFAAIGVTVIVFLWGTPFDDFHSPPLFFRIFGSLIAIVFVAVGGSIGVASLRGTGPGMIATPPATSPGAPEPHRSGGPGENRPGAYQCPNCGAPLGASADVSPSGDAKCAFCGRWFNVHRSV